MNRVISLESMSIILKVKQNRLFIVIGHTVWQSPCLYILYVDSDQTEDKMTAYLCRPRMGRVF